MITHLTDKAIGVQELDSNMVAHYHFIGTDGLLYANYGQIDIQFDCQLPEGQWEILGKASELTEDQWRGIVDCFEQVNYQNYERDYPYHDPFPTATESGFSLLKSKSLDPHTTLILIQNT